MGKPVGGGPKGNGKKARQGLVRVFENPEARFKNSDEAWREVSRIYRRTMGLALEIKKGRAVVGVLWSVRDLRVRV